MLHTWNDLKKYIFKDENSKSKFKIIERNIARIKPSLSVTNLNSKSRGTNLNMTSTKKSTYPICY